MTSTFERAMAQNANTVPLRHELAGNMGATPSTATAGIGMAVAIALILRYGNTNTDNLVPLMAAGLGGLTLGGYLQNR